MTPPNPRETRETSGAITLITPALLINLADCLDAGMTPSVANELRIYASILAKEIPDRRSSPLAEGVVDVDNIGTNHPTSRYIFRRMCAAFGVELGKDRVDEALDKIEARMRLSTPTASQDVQAQEYLTLEKLVPMWDAINEFADAPKLSVRRQKAVVKVECIVRALLQRQPVEVKP